MKYSKEQKKRIKDDGIDFFVKRSKRQIEIQKQIDEHYLNPEPEKYEILESKINQ